MDKKRLAVGIFLFLNTLVSTPLLAATELVTSVPAVVIPNTKLPQAPISTSITTPTAPTPGLTGKSLQKTYTLTEISGADGFMLRGANASRILFLPILNNWKIDSVRVHFTLFSAALFDTANTVTAYINDSPIGSLQVNGHLNANIPWDITIPANLIKGSVINLTIANMVNDYGFSCLNLSNPKYWVYITGASTVTYNYILENYLPDLSKFPYPFINDPSIEQDTVIVVFPDKPSLADYTAAFNVSNALLQYRTWRGIKFVATTVSRLSEDQKKNYNLIYIGTNKELNLAASNINWPLSVTDDIADKTQRKIGEKTGILMMATSPWNGTKGVLAVTGNSEDALIKAAIILRDKNFVNTVLFHEYALINQAPSAMNYHPSWTETTLGDLNFQNQVVYGNGLNTINYDVHLPEDKIVSGIDLSVDYSVSPFLSVTESSYLTLRVNDVPMGGISFSVGNSKIKKWNIHIDGKDLKPGMNRISFIFNLNMKNRYCKPEDNSLAWGTIFSSTTLVLKLDSGKVLLKFKLLKSTANSLLISVPDNQPFFQSADFGQQVIDLSGAMPLVSEVNFISNAALTPENAAEKDVIYIGNINDNPALAALKASIPFYYLNKQFVIDPQIRPYLSISREVPVNINELINSPFNPNRMLMLILSDDPSGYDEGISLFTDPKKSSLINGNVSLSYVNGTFTSVQTDQIAVKIYRGRITKALILSGFGLLIFGSLFAWIGIKIYRKVKAYFTVNNKGDSND